MFCLLGVVIFVARLAQEYGLGKSSRNAFQKLRAVLIGSLRSKGWGIEALCGPL